MAKLSHLIGQALLDILLDEIGAGWCLMINSIRFLAVIGTLQKMKILFKQTIRKHLIFQKK